MKRIVIAAALVVAGIVGFAGGSPAAADDDTQGQEVCGPLDSGKKNTTGDPLSVTVTAPEGKVITGYCVKAGSDQSVEDGAVQEFQLLEPYPTTLEITHPSGKAVSHYSVSYGVPDEVEPLTPEEPQSTPPSCTTEGTVTIPPNSEGYEYASETKDGMVIVTVSAIGDAKLTGNVGPWEFPIAKTTGAECDPEDPTPSLRISALSPVCVDDIPYIDYAVALDGLDPAGKTATLTIRDKSGNEVSKLAGQPLAGRILYPGASADPQDWPGWKQTNGKWEFDETDARLREGVTITVDVNPSASGSVSYPPATEKCNSPENETVTAAGPVPPAPPAAAPPAAAPPAAAPPAAAPPAAAPPAAAPPATVTALPSTGSGSWLLALLATMLVLAGSGFVALGRRTR